VKLTTDLPGRTVPYRVADVRPQVSGVVLRRLFTEGGEVKAGQSLYLIDPAPFQAALGSAQAALSKAEASEHVAAANVERYQPLVEVNAISKQDYDDAVATQETAQADVASARVAGADREDQSRLHERAVADHRPRRPLDDHRRRAGHQQRRRRRWSRSSSSIRSMSTSCSRA
jgi:RND family efflux transporter MFP subunit